MIAQVVFDLPLEGHFDYLIPEHLASCVTVGMRVKVSFGRKAAIGYVTGLADESAFSKLKPIGSLCDSGPVFDAGDLAFARDFAAYYGCSLGEALGTVFRGRQGDGPSVRREHQPVVSLYRCRPDGYAGKIRQIIDSCRDAKVLVLVPDAFRAETIVASLNRARQGAMVKTGTRSSVFEADGRYGCVIMVDEEDRSYKQEQMPMYETRRVLFMRSRMCGFDIAFVGLSPSAELMSLVHEGKIRIFEDAAVTAAARVVDLSNYKVIPGLISPPVRDALEAGLKAGRKSIMVLNRRGSYRLTRCVDCGEVLKCGRCDSPLIYSRSQKKYLCRHCAYTAAGDTACPRCHKPSWRSQGIGVEQLQTELKKFFPQANVRSFERSSGPVGDFDILIATQAVLRFQGRWQVQTAAFIDFDAELNRLDMNSAFQAFSLALHVSSMASELFIQTRNISHYVVQSLSRGKVPDFYEEELKLRKELGFSPFKHWVRLSWRGRSEKSTHQAALDVYNVLSRTGPKDYGVTPPLADAVGRKRGQFCFNVMLQVDDVPAAVTFIKSTLTRVKRHSRVITTVNVDP